mmetsp:Transcript_14999/g.38523  ORF Transcript_14999/g.38523 Transcript_14999/m.38523 type:complete len:266 (-) Transcript_14999:422-1219(-)
MRQLEPRNPPDRAPGVSPIHHLGQPVLRPRDCLVQREAARKIGPDHVGRINQKMVPAKRSVFEHPQCCEVEPTLPSGLGLGLHRGNRWEEIRRVKIIPEVLLRHVANVDSTERAVPGAVRSPPRPRVLPSAWLGGVVRGPPAPLVGPRRHRGGRRRGSFCEQLHVKGEGLCLAAIFVLRRVLVWHLDPLSKREARGGQNVSEFGGFYEDGSLEGEHCLCKGRRLGRRVPVRELLAEPCRPLGGSGFDRALHCCERGDGAVGSASH